MPKRYFCLRMFRTAARIAVLVISFSYATTHARPWHSSGDQIKGAFKNEKAVLRGDSIVISFRLDAPADETYRVSIRLKKRDDPGFGRTLRFVRGDVGEGEFGQKGCRIVWQFRRELSETELGEDYWFELTCEIVEHGIPWWVYAGGGAAAIVIVAALLPKDKPPPTSVLPGPPDYRPVTP